MRTVGLLLGLAPALVLPLGACGAGPDSSAADAAPPDSALVVVDDSGNELRLAHPARRIVSLIPSASESLVAIGAGDLVVGRTDFDTDPALASVPSVGGGTNPSLEALLALAPDLVVGWEGDKSPGLRQRLASMGIPLFELHAQDTTDVFRNLERLGRLSGHAAGADSVTRAIRAQLAAVRASVAGLDRPSVLYVVWSDPPMTAGRGAFISQLVSVAGGEPLFGDLGTLWPTVSLEEIVRRDPELVILPHGERREHSAATLRNAGGWRELRAIREGRLVSVPADLVNRPGPRIGEAAVALSRLIHPGIGDAPR